MAVPFNRIKQECGKWIITLKRDYEKEYYLNNLMPLLEKQERKNICKYLNVSTKISNEELVNKMWEVK